MDSTVALIDKLEEAVALGKKKGLDTATWEQKLELIKQAQEVAQRTFDILNTRGWCLWKCRALNDEVIVVIRDELVVDHPHGYPVYLEQELEYLLEVKDSTLRLIHEAKKLSGATVIGVENQLNDAGNMPEREPRGNMKGGHE